MNDAEQAIQTFKNHFVSGLYTIDVECSLQLCAQMAKQAVITLNIQQKACINPSELGYHQLHVYQYDWSTHLMASSRSRLAIYLDAKIHIYWDMKGLDICYCIPNINHYLGKLFMLLTYNHILC